MKKFCTLLVLAFTVITANAQIINFPDANFKAKLLSLSPSVYGASLSVTGLPSVSIDTNANGEIEVSEAQAIIKLSVTGGEITDLTGLEYFTNLYTFGVSQNPVTNINLSGLQNLRTLTVRQTPMTTINLSVVPNLTTLSLTQGAFTTIDVSMLSNLTYFEYNYGALTNIDFSNNHLLTQINCINNSLTSLDLTQCTALQTLQIQSNQLTNLNISGLSNLEVITCGYNLLTTLNLDGTNINRISCENNPITSLDLSNQTNLESILLSNTLVETIDLNQCSLATNIFANNCPNLRILLVKNSAGHNQLQFSGCPNIEYVCVDDNNLVNMYYKLSAYGYTNCNFNTYCNFTPSGIYYTLQGNTKLDIDNNGCDINDIAFTNQKFTISDNTNTGTHISNASGNYSIPVQSGTHTITPIIENPSYFTISPTSSSVTFPAAASPNIQDFCVTANGVHNDVEVSIIATNAARPGFDADYKIIYKNKGNQVSDGSLSFSFDDAKMDLVSATPVNTSSATNSLSWNYTGLNPFETRTIDLVFNINSPMETPAVNGDDVLIYTATIVGATDEMPGDNAMTLNQTVVNSYDPNDKTCVEGNTITPSMVGEYVHYVIRFENTGTFPAENVVVSDMIDLTKFDIASLVPQSSSHSFVTRINNTTGKVEFIFENINLPFDDANNDGYVAFKIKTKPTLVLGNTFSNTANIYFDYNFPITTNTTSTTVSLLGTQDFDFSSVFRLSPVPTKDVLTITNNQNLTITSASIYNTLGQLVQVSTNPSESIDVSGLKTGNYVIKIISDKGTASGKFIKE